MPTRDSQRSKFYNWRRTLPSVDIPFDDVELRCDTHVYGHPAILNIPDEPYIANYDVCSIVANYIASKNRKLFGELHSPHYCRIYAETLSKISSVSLLNIVNSMIKSGLSVEDVVK